jgi:hypothetical protein
MKNEKNLLYFSYCSQTVIDRNLIFAVHIEHDQKTFQYEQQGYLVLGQFVAEQFVADSSSQ